MWVQKTGRVDGTAVTACPPAAAVHTVGSRSRGKRGCFDTRGKEPAGTAARLGTVGLDKRAGVSGSTKPLLNVFSGNFIEIYHIHHTI